MKNPHLALLCGSIALAVVSSLLTWWPREARTAGPAAVEAKLLNKGGEKVAPEDVADVLVIEWDKDKKAPRRFEVANKKGTWVIPSHYDYPADAGAQNVDATYGGPKVGRTAGGVLNAVRGPLFSSDSQTHAKLGLLDPETPGPAEEDARGRRMVLKDASGKVLLDLIIGRKAQEANLDPKDWKKRVDAPPKSDVYYVREAGDDRVYTAAVNPEISTRFKDWVETEFLKVPSDDIRQVEILEQSLSQAGELETKARTAFSRPKGTTDWTCAKTPDGKVVNQDTLSSLLSEVRWLKLENIQPFRQRQLEACGFFLVPAARVPPEMRTLVVNLEQNQRFAVIGSEGCIVLHSKDGLRYHLFFGAADVEGGGGATKTAKPEGEGHNRYMSVFVLYDKNEDENAKTEVGEKKEPKIDEKKAEEGQKKAEQAQDRFLRFFYVVSGDSFKRLRPKLDSLFKVPEKKEPEKKDGEKKDEAKKDELKKDEPKREEPKKDGVKKDEPKKDAARKDEPKKDSVKKDEPK